MFQLPRAAKRDALLPTSPLLGLLLRCAAPEDPYRLHFLQCPEILGQSAGRQSNTSGLGWDWWQQRGQCRYVGIQVGREEQWLGT